jgi:hypothetical protein
MCRIQINKKERVCGGVDCVKLADERLHMLAFCTHGTSFRVLFRHQPSDLQQLKQYPVPPNNSLIFQYNEDNSDNDAHEFMFLQQ